MKLQDGYQRHRGRGGCPRKIETGRVSCDFEDRVFAQGKRSTKSHEGSRNSAVLLVHALMICLAFEQSHSVGQHRADDVEAFAHRFW